MPLIKQHISQFGPSEDLEDDSTSLHRYVDQDDQANMSDSSSMIHRARPRKNQTPIPIIPVKSSMRASRIFDNLTIQLHDIKTPSDFDAQLITKLIDGTQDPHESYLSSEEDGSESADESVEGSDASYVELDEEFGQASERSSFEETAKSVAFVFVGKAQVVDVFSHHTDTLALNTPIAKRSSSLRPQLFRSNTSATSKSSKNSLSRRPSACSSRSHGASTISVDSDAFPVPALPSSQSLLSFPSLSRSRTRSQTSARRQTVSPLPISNVPELLPRSAQKATPTPALPQLNDTTAWKSSRASLGKWGLGVRKRPSMPLLSASFNASRVSLKDGEVTSRSPVADSIAEDQIYNPATAVPSTSPPKNGHKKNRLSLNLSSLNLSSALEKSDITPTRRDYPSQSAIEAPKRNIFDPKSSDSIVTRVVTVSAAGSRPLDSPVRSNTTGNLMAPRPVEAAKQSRSSFKMFGSWGRSTAKA